MKIVWFSEIKWSYLRTRKQHILANFSSSDEILFIEPASFNLKNKFNISIEKNIKYVTVPQLQNSDISFINYLIHFTPLKFCLIFLSRLWMNRLFEKLNFIPDVIITSNIFWIHYIQNFSKKYNIKVIYDCNDNPLAFPNALNCKNYFNKTLDYASHIIVPHRSYKKFIFEKYHNKIDIISNGVDSELENFKSQKIEKLENIDKIVMYIGSIDTRIDYELINYLANDLTDFSFVFIGDLKRQVISKFNTLLNNHNNIHHFDSINYYEMGAYLSYAKICIIPFLRTNLSKSILPNKVFEYSLLKKPFIMTDFNRDLNTLHHSILIANNHKQFKDFVKQQMLNPYDTKELQNFTFDYRWDKISEKYKKFLISSLKK